MQKIKFGAWHQAVREKRWGKSIFFSVHTPGVIPHNAPGGICNGITFGFKDEHDIDFNLTYQETGADHDWRWGEQWLPHASWYLYAIAIL